ncbi:MAG: alpha/beta hydrolase [Deltaproteobacteria bacterium]|nr:MAG: alpha/beta hydrolase [Deltaproteobacteria bacterium]
MSHKPINLSPFRHLYPFDSHFMDISGFKYHYVDEGAGSPVIMVHGNPTWSFYYRQLIQALSHQYRTIAVDHIGCGLSDKPTQDQYDYTLDCRINDLERFISRLELKDKITLVLHDWGGMIGIAYALRHLDRMDKIILLNTAAFFPPQGRPLPFRLKLIRHIKPFANVAVLGFNAFARSALFMATAKGLSGDVKSGLLAPYNCRQNRIATLKFVEDIPLKPTDPSYDTVKTVQNELHRLRKLPMLICWGMKDFVFTKAYLDEWCHRFPDARVHTFEDAGHYVLEDAAEMVIDRIRKFMLKDRLRE